MCYFPPFFFFFGINIECHLFLVVQGKHGSYNQGMPSPIEAVSHTVKEDECKGDACSALTQWVCTVV